MAPLLTLDATDVLNPADVAADEEFELDMRVVEATTPLVTMMCATDDGCGTSCSTSACTTSSNDPS
ncbi:MULTISPECIES: FxLD family lanthipeptide [Nonomuraea]|jgi:FxLD family lantipeptide|uniref:FxLD family lanthipeptide n=1 Tax=Nonomuraea TaxID=83681 RepID=UPI00332086A9